MSRPERRLMWGELGVRNAHRLASALTARNKHRLASSVSAGPRVARGGDAATTGAGAAIPGGTRSDAASLRAGTALAAEATTTGPTPPQAPGIGDSAAPGATDC